MGLPRVHKHKARKDLYRVGLKIINSSKQGFKIDRTKPSIEEEDEIVVPAGSVYFAFKRKRSPWTYQLTEPVFPRIVSEYVEKTEEFESRKSEVTTVKERDELQSDVESYRDELQERLSNMPDSLQDSSVLNERIEELETLISEIGDMEISDEDDEDEEE